MRHRQPLLASALLTAVLLTAPAAAQDEPIDLADDPFEISDPIAAAPGTAEIGFVGAYERARRGRVRDTWAGEMEIELGVAPRLELRIGQGGAHGNLETRRRLGAVSDLAEGTGNAGTPEDGDRPRWGGTTQFGALYQLSDDRGAAPAIGLLGRLRTLYGPGRTGYEAEGVVLIGKTISSGRLPFGAHVNLGWTTRLDPQPGERTNRYLLNASLGQAVTQDTALVVTYARSQQERGDRDFSLLQAGVRHRLPGGGPVLGLAIGTGLNRDSPRFQIAFAVQWALSN
ncbi:MAG TPA: hypothetical protein VIL69_13915 [Roseomonas sp.]|jgi:hypothetical protein